MLASLRINRILALRTLPKVSSLIKPCACSALTYIPSANALLSPRSFSQYAPLLYSTSQSDTTSESEFRKHSENTLLDLMDQLDMVFESLASDCDVDYSMGVLTINLGNKGCYVLNQQPPNRQIWLSSPISSPKRFSYDSATNSWLSTIDSIRLTDILTEELSSLLDFPVSIHK
ncbi:hypothetical protein BB561_001590 [Smittium simulii]|uniref:ferroxidase n=1 Tax=Smittium simulii TaxID=133385 RepID=A0A2T9YU15_9FUNG|nr:hypothetical protein BB561_001590 [Smittium simulii]